MTCFSVVGVNQNAEQERAHLQVFKMDEDRDDVDETVAHAIVEHSPLHSFTINLCQPTSPRRPTSASMSKHGRCSFFAVSFLLLLMVRRSLVESCRQCHGCR